MHNISQIIEAKATEVTVPDRLQILEITDPDTAREIIEGLGTVDARQNVLRLLEAHNCLLRLAGDPHESLPTTFSAQLKSVTNRGETHGKPATEDTSQQETEFGPARSIRLQVVKLLLADNNAVSEILNYKNDDNRWRRDFNRDLIMQGKDADIGQAILSLVPLAQNEQIFKDLVTEMQSITQNIPHLKQRWGQEANGTVIIVPEQNICHRRNGLVSGQVVWHADLNGGIIFCQDKGTEHPKRMLFKQDGAIIGNESDHISELSKTMLAKLPYVWHAKG